MELIKKKSHGEVAVARPEKVGEGDEGGGFDGGGWRRRWRSAAEVG